MRFSVEKASLAIDEIDEGELKSEGRIVTSPSHASVKFAEESFNIGAADGDYDEKNSKLLPTDKNGPYDGEVSKYGGDEYSEDEEKSVEARKPFKVQYFRDEKSLQCKLSLIIKC